MLAAHSAQVGADDGEVLWGELSDSLELNNNLVECEEVQAMRSHFDAEVTNGDRLLLAKGDTSRSKLDREGILVDGLKESRTQRAMDLNGCPNDRSSLPLPIQCHGDTSCFPCFLIS